MRRELRLRSTAIAFLTSRPNGHPDHAGMSPRSFATCRPPMDLFVMTPVELESQRQVANTLAREVSERGLVCYG